MECSVDQAITIQKVLRGWRLRRKLRAVLAQYQKTMNEAFNFPINPAPKSLRDYYRNDPYDKLLSEYFELSQAVEALERSGVAPTD